MRLRGRLVKVVALVAAAVVVAGACADDDSGGAGAEGTTTTQGSDPLLVETALGQVQGGASAVAGVRNFLGIPFAEPPVGDDAWRPPRPREPSDETFDATGPAASCPQTEAGVTTAFVITPPSDPDCLTLSVWAPDDAEDLPVMVWFHGGGLTTGSAHEPYYIGDDLADEGVVVVNVNYRLGPQGFLAVEALADESSDGAVGNYGLLDQQAGLEWVQANIAGFGGDPDAVTIFGESAGGRSVCAHLTSPGSGDLFDQAIVQSGGGCGPFPEAEETYEGGERFMEAAGCDDVSCLRALPEADLIAAADALAEAADEDEAGDEDEVDFTFVADGVNLSESGVDRAEAGDLDDTPVLIGSNADESTLFTLQLDEPSDAELVELVADVTDDPEALLALYPKADFASNLERYQALSTDVGFTCPTLSFAAAAPSAFVYHHTYVSEQNPLGLGATHGAELAPLFRHPEGLDIDIEQNDETARMSDLIQDAWVGFATSGDPGDEFELYDDGQTVTLTDVPVEQVDEIRGGRCPEVTELSSTADR